MEEGALDSFTRHFQSEPNWCGSGSGGRDKRLSAQRGDGRIFSEKATKKKNHPLLHFFRTEKVNSLIFLGKKENQLRCSAEFHPLKKKKKQRRLQRVQGKRITEHE